MIFNAADLCVGQSHLEPGARCTVSVNCALLPERVGRSKSDEKNWSRVCLHYFFFVAAHARNQVLDDPDYSLVKALQTAQQNFVITDPTLPDNPIVFASQGFLELTGYTLEQVRHV